jgi:hypothetical protein
MILKRKTIRYWKLWKQKHKIVFCVVCSTIYAILTFFTILMIKFFSGSDDNLFETSFYLSIGILLISTFFGITFWYENKKRYNKRSE